MDEWEICGKKGTIQGTKFTATASRVAAYGKQIISKGICEWKIKYNFTEKQCCREIGIGTNTDILDNYINSKCIVWYNTNIYARGSATADKVEKIDKKNDIITITLDLHQNKVFFHKNNDQGKKFTVSVEPNQSYRLAAQLDTAGQSFTIISFRCTFGNSDMYIGDIPSLVEIKSAIANKLQMLNEFDPVELKEIPLNDLLTLQQDIDHSQTEFKEIEQSFDDIKQKLTSVKAAVTQAITPDVSNYKNWKPKDIVRYVCLLENGRFGNISDALLKSFTEQGINGCDLVDIEKNDLFTMGVKNFKDRNSIYSHFQALKQKGKEGSYTQVVDK